MKEFYIYLNNALSTGLINLKSKAMQGNSNFEYFYKQSNGDSFEDIILSFFKKNKVRTR